MKAIARRPAAIYLLLAGAFVGTYIGLSAVGGFVGFPLDDAWIYQTYARSLGQHLELVFRAGQPSAGSTSPLWTALLAVGYALRVDYRVWAFGLGALMLAANAWLAHRLVQRLWPAHPRAAWVAGLLVVAEWHLVWSAASGMETLAYSAVALLIFTLEPHRAGWLGAIAGLALFARPDGLSLAPFALLRAAQPAATDGQANGPATVNWRGPLTAGLSFAAVAAGYLLFNWAAAGAPWPNTLFAKQAEYASLRELPLLFRLARVSVLPFIGPAALVVPGLILACLAARQAPHPLDLAAPVVWAAGLIFLYALRLPVTYQHGRYLIPVIPVLLSSGLGAWAARGPNLAGALAARVLARAWGLSIVLVSVAFWGLGAQAYARDVALIETEMVRTAHWLAANTEAEALIAVHDIGAVGYFSDRELLDLAGLVSPEVIPFIRDETRLAQWLTDRQAQYLVVFPHWYNELAQPPTAIEIYSTGGPIAPLAGGENMSVYRWNAATR